MLKRKGIFKEFDVWFALAKDRPGRSGDSRFTPIPYLLMPYGCHGGLSTHTTN